MAIRRSPLVRDSSCSRRGLKLSPPECSSLDRLVHDPRLSHQSIYQISKRLNLAEQILCFPMEQDPVHQLVLRALRGSGIVVANPATIPKAIEKGEPITVTLPLSDEAAINKLFEQW